MSGQPPPAAANSPAGDAWYPDPAAYWVPATETGERPFRYGDLCRTPAVDRAGQPLVSGSGPVWHAVMVLSPSCELVSKAKDDSLIDVARVVPLSAQDPNPAAAIVAGWQEKDGRVRVAYAHTVFLAGVPHAQGHEDGMFATLRDTTRVRYADLRTSGRVAALEHDARVAVIRRELYYRYRWLVPMSDVRAAEAARIRADAHFQGPRPPWGEPARD